MMAKSNRDAILGLVAILGMGLLGIIAMMAQWIKEGWLLRWWRPHDPVLTLLLCGVIGAAVGMVSIPCVVPCLRRTDLRVSPLIVYGFNAIVVSLYVIIKPTGLTGPLSASVVALVGVCTSAWLLKQVDPSRNKDIGSHAS
jgi:peptidoglycan/LPS O-acetylase OafA/YrhL